MKNNYFSKNYAEICTKLIHDLVQSKLTCQPQSSRTSVNANNGQPPLTADHLLFIVIAILLTLPLDQQPNNQHRFLQFLSLSIAMQISFPWPGHEYPFRGPKTLLSSSSPLLPKSKPLRISPVKNSLTVARSCIIYHGTDTHGSCRASSCGCCFCMALPYTNCRTFIVLLTE